VCNFHCFDDLTSAQVGVTVCVSGASRPWFVRCHHTFSAVMMPEWFFLSTSDTNCNLHMPMPVYVYVMKMGTLLGHVQHNNCCYLVVSDYFLQRYCVVTVNGLFIVDAIIYWH